MPEIKVKVNLKDTALIVKGFIDAKITLADKFLRYQNQNIDFILGYNDAQVLPVTVVKFGGNNSSIYSSSKLGAMLTGSVSRMLTNLLTFIRTILMEKQTSGGCKETHSSKIQVIITPKIRGSSRAASCAPRSSGSVPRAPGLLECCHCTARGQREENVCWRLDLSKWDGSNI